MTKPGDIREIIVTCDKWLESLAPASLTAEEKREAKVKYSAVIEMLRRYIPLETAGREIRITLAVFHYNGARQFISNGDVSDLGRPVRNEYNWHLQNTSQWLFACGIVFDKETREFSTHT